MIVTDVYTATQKNGAKYLHPINGIDRARGLCAKITSATWAVITGTSINIDSQSFDNSSTEAMLDAVSVGETVIQIIIIWSTGEESVIDYTITVI